MMPQRPQLCLNIRLAGGIEAIEKAPGRLGGKPLSQKHLPGGDDQDDGQHSAQGDVAEAPAADAGADEPTYGDGGAPDGDRDRLNRQGSVALE